MKFTVLILCLACGARALPSLVYRQSPEAVADELLFDIVLPEFSSRRDARDPPTLNWSSTSLPKDLKSADNPQPACNRHDFGYNNYRDQGRFTVSSKLRIDDNFKDDLDYQCESESVQVVCKGLADVYYAAVRAFGGDDATPGKREEDLVAIYEEKLSIYNDLVKQAQDEGLLPVLEG